MTYGGGGVLLTPCFMCYISMCFLYFCLSFFDTFNLSFFYPGILSFLPLFFLSFFLSFFLTTFLSFLSSIFRFHILLVFRGDWCPFMARHPAHINYGNSVYGVDSSLPNYSIRGEKNYRVLTVQQANRWGEENVDWLGIYGRLKCTYPTSYNPRITLSTSNPFLFFAVQRCTRLIGRCVSWCGQNQTLWWLSTMPL